GQLASVALAERPLPLSGRALRSLAFAGEAGYRGLFDAHRRRRAEIARRDDETDDADRVGVGHLHGDIRALRERGAVGEGDRDVALVESRGCALGGGGGCGLGGAGAQRAADGGLARALAGGGGHLDVIVEDDTELQDREQDQQQHGKDHGELDDRLTLLVLLASLEHAILAEVGLGKERRRVPEGDNATETRRDRQFYMAEITLERTAEILLLRRPRVTTTAMVMTPRTTAYSAIVWPDSSLRSANRRLRYSIKE